jgi:Protein of unknown function (DUF3800)
VPHRAICLVIQRHSASDPAEALALFYGRKAERLLVIVTVYIDESGTHGSSVTILGCWVGRLGQWAVFDRKWRRMLKRYGVTHFHSKDIKHTQDEFKGWSIIKKKELLGDAGNLGVKNLEFGFTILLKEEDYQKHYIAGHRPKEVQLDSRYGLCFRYCIGLVTNLAIQSFKCADLEISFVLEAGHPNFGDTERVFVRAKKSRLEGEQFIVRTLKTLTVGNKEDFPGLQIADAIAYSAFQHVTRKPQQTVAIGNGDPDKYMERAKTIQHTPILHLRDTATQAAGAASQAVIQSGDCPNTSRARSMSRAVRFASFSRRM